MTAVQVFPRRADGSIGGGPLKFESLDVVVRWRDVGRWTLVSRDPGTADFFDARNVGVVIKRGDTVLLSGPVDYVSRQKQGGATTLTVAGPDDTVHIANRLAFPLPSAVVTAQTDAYDMRTGPAEDLLVYYVRANLVNVPSDRAKIAMTIPASLGRGGQRSYRARFDPLLEVCRGVLANAPALGFRIAQRTDRAIGLDVWEASDLRTSGPLFDGSASLDWTYVEQWPTVTRVVVGGGEEKYERRFRLRARTADEATWNRSVETFIDERGIDGVARTITSGVTGSVDGVIDSITSGLSGEADDETFTTTANHGLSVGDRVRFTDKNGGKGLLRDTYYWVKSTPTNKTFRLSYDSDRNDLVTLDSDMTSGDLDVIDLGKRWSITTDDAHGLANGAEIRFSRRNGGKGLALNKSYYVRDRTSTTFRLSESSTLGDLVRFDTDITSAGIDVMDWAMAAAEMDEAADEELTEGSASQSFRLVVTESFGVEYGTHVRVGDLVRAYPGGIQVDDRITEATIRIDESGETTEMWIGQKDDDPDERVERRARRFDWRLRQLEGSGF